MGGTRREVLPKWPELEASVSERTAEIGLSPSLGCFLGISSSWIPSIWKPALPSLALLGPECPFSREPVSPEPAAA